MQLGQVVDPMPLVMQAIAHDVALDMGLTLTYNDLSQPEYVALQMLREERKLHRAVNDKRDQIMQEARAENKPLEF